MERREVERMRGARPGDVSGRIRRPKFEGFVVTSVPWREEQTASDGRPNAPRDVGDRLAAKA